MIFFSQTYFKILLDHYSKKKKNIKIPLFIIKKKLLKQFNIICKFINEIVKNFHYNVRVSRGWKHVYASYVFIIHDRLVNCENINVW